MTTKKQPESEANGSEDAVLSDVDAWMRNFVEHFESRIVEAGRTLPVDATISQLQQLTAQAILATYLDSGMEFESVVELFGLAAVKHQSANLPWNDALNQRRFELIDKDIQGLLTPPEKFELAGLTGLMRKHVESETDLPMAGAQALHRKLLELESRADLD